MESVVWIVISSLQSKVKNISDELSFEICEGSNVLGKLVLPLVKLENQEEYDLHIEIPDENRDNESFAKLNTKCQFIKSYYNFYRDNALKAESNKKDYEASLKDSKKLFDNLNGNFQLIKEPFGYFEQLNNNPELKKFHNINVNSNTGGKTYHAGEQTAQDKMEADVADKLENFLKNSLSN